MNIVDLINADRIDCACEANSKKRALERLSALMARSSRGLTEEEVFSSLIGRERLGSTGLGHGVAIPHGRIKGRDEAIGAFVRLGQGVDFDAIDNRPVDLMFALLVPEHFTDEHLELLSELAHMFADERFCEQLRNSDDDEQVLRMLQQGRPAGGAGSG